MRSYGNHVRMLEVDGLIITESLRGASEVLPRHSHEFTNVNFVLGGNFLETVGRVETRCNPNSVVIRPGGEFHSNEYGEEGSHCLIVEILPQRLKMLSPLSSVLDRAKCWEIPWLQSQIKRFYCEFQMSDSASLIGLDCILLETLSRLSEIQEDKIFVKPPAWLLRAKDCIQDQFSQSLRLSQIANDAGVHPAHLSKSFRKYFRITPGEFVRNLRLEHAAALLISTRNTVAEISISCGFYDQSHFVRVFKARYAVTPTQYRFLNRAGKF